MAEDNYDFVNDIIIRNKDTKRIYAYNLDSYWQNISNIDNYYSCNMDFLKPDVRDFFFKQYIQKWLICHRQNIILVQK